MEVVDLKILVGKNLTITVADGGYADPIILQHESAPLPTRAANECFDSFEHFEMKTNRFQRVTVMALEGCPSFRYAVYIDESLRGYSTRQCISAVTTFLLSAARFSRSLTSHIDERRDAERRRLAYSMRVKEAEEAERKAAAEAARQKSRILFNELDDHETE